MAVMRAGRGDMGAGRDQLRAKLDDPRIACRRAGLDHQQRIAGLGPQQLGERAPFGLADFADQVARDHEIGGLGLVERARASPRRQVIAQSRACSRPRSSASVAQGGVGIEQREILSEENASAAAQVAVPGPAPTSSRLSGAKSGLHLAKRVQAGGDRGISRGHPRQRVGQRIGSVRIARELPPSR